MTASSATSESPASSTTSAADAASSEAPAARAMPRASDVQSGASGPCSPEPLCRATYSFNRLLTYGQALALFGIAAATMVGIGLSIVEMFGKNGVNLADLLMLFLYVEILSMVKGSALGTREIPIHTPIALAIVAVARFMVVDVEHMTPQFMLYTSGAIFVLAAALWVIKTLNRTEKNVSVRNAFAKWCPFCTDRKA